MVLELCGMDFSIFLQTEYAMFGRGQGADAGRFEKDQAGIPASCEDELAVTSDGDRRAVGMASNSTSGRGSSGLVRLPGLGS